jgi:SRSO17 transposase
LSQTERKNGWWLADFAGDATPDGMRRLLNFYAWSADAVRDVLRGYVTAGIGDPAGVLVIDETGFLKRDGCRPACKGSTPARRAGSGTAT